MISNSNVQIHFSDDLVEVAHIVMAVSLFRTFRDQGLLTDEEYRIIASNAENRWRNILCDDSMGTNRVVFKEQKNE